ncbi:MAG TPA: PLP-dependent aminotransferase family protein [Rhizomicrobium sp.]|nr:PLP-dependent aminotransferase family protein [Rhizomicrobium sp.]
MGIVEDSRPLSEASAEKREASHHPADFPLALSAIALSPTSSVPLYEQICRGIRTAVSAGDLQPGTAMPTIVELARALGVARNTVGEAYTRLSAEGYLVSYKRRGTRVANQLPRLAERAEARPLKTGKPAIEIGYFARKMLDTPLTQRGSGRPFALHSPDPALFPRMQLSRLVTEEFRRPLDESQLGAGGGCQRFQSAVAGYLRQSAGVHCEPEQVIAVTTPECALNLAARVLIDPGHTVLVEDPASDIVRSAFLAAGARLETMPVDSKGADPRRISGPPPRLIWVSPAMNFPLGQQMPESRRLQVLDAARHAGAVLFESNTYGELVYTGHRLRAIQGHDAEGRVIYSGSFHRTLGPGIRVSYLVVPQALVEPFTEMRARLACAPDVFMQSALATFVKENRYALHLKKIRAVYAERLRQTIAACRKHIPDAAISEPSGGFHLVLRLDGIADEQRICLAAAKDGLQIQALSQFYQDPRRGAGLVIGFGAMAEQTIEPSVARLAGIIREQARAA